MYVYLSKKIAVPNNTNVKCLSWNKEGGYIACGGDGGLLKVLKLDNVTTAKTGALAATSNLSMNQSLEGHSGAVQNAVWNEYHHKLTTCDENGLIIVWVLYRGSWYEEMINDRKKSVVKDMKWDPEGQKVAIIYEDGNIIVGSVDGNRIWGKDIRNVRLQKVAWSPDGKLLLFGMVNGEVHIYDSIGTPLSKVEIRCEKKNLVYIDWYDGIEGYVEPRCPCLAIIYDNGFCQLMRDEKDAAPIILDTGLLITDARWDNRGSILAIAGTQKGVATDGNSVQFYTPFGEHMRTLKIPGKAITSCSWEGTGLRVALAIDSFIYFANIRPNYKWGYCTNTIIYAFMRPDQFEHSVMFWNIKSDERHVRSLKNLTGIAACEDHSCMATRSEDVPSQHSLIVCNSMGTPLDSRYIDMDPVHLTMTSTTVFAASREAIYVWTYRTSSKPDAMALARVGRERLIHIDDPAVAQAESAPTIDFNKAQQRTEDLITCIAASESSLLVGRESGAIQLYILPGLTMHSKHTLRTQPYKLFLNSTSSRAAIIDVSGGLSLFEFGGMMTEGAAGYGKQLEFDRRDVWDIRWASDNADMFAIMEKTKMFVFRGQDAEEPVVSSGYLSSFSDLEVGQVLLDEIMRDPDNPTLDSLIVIEVKSLRDVREVLNKGGLQQASDFVEVNPHPRLWRLLAEYSLEHLDLKIAEHAFVKSKDYPGIQFVKRLKHIQNDSMKMAEVAAYFRRYEDAEKIYNSTDRRDLALNLHKKLGNWTRVLKLVKSGETGDDLQLQEAWSAIGDYFADRQEWAKAATYYIQGRNHDRICDCYYMLEDFEGLEKVMRDLPENHKLLEDIGNKFASVGMCGQAVESYVKANAYKQAIDACVQLNHWNKAVELAKKHNVREIDGQLSKYAERLLQEKKLFTAVELFRKAGRYLEAAKILFDVARDEAKKKLSKPLRLKKLHVLGALLVEQYNDNMKQSARREKSTHSSLYGLLDDESTAGFFDATMVNHAWRGAEAYHFYILAQRQLLKGYRDAAFRTTLVLREYDDMIDPCEVYSCLALAASSVRAFGACSKAMSKLESLESIPAELRRQYESLAVDIFTKNPAKDTRSATSTPCFRCDNAVNDGDNVCSRCETVFPTCVVSGRPIYDPEPWMCPQCKHHAYAGEMRSWKSCPLCHFAVRTPVY